MTRGQQSAMEAGHRTLLARMGASRDNRGLIVGNGEQPLEELATAVVLTEGDVVKLHVSRDRDLRRGHAEVFEALGVGGEVAQKRGASSEAWVLKMRAGS